MSSARPASAVLAETAARLEKHSDSPRADMEILLAHVLGLTRAQLFAHLDDVPDGRALRELDALVGRRLRGEPVAYLTGEKGFWTLNLKVTPDVLVPRPETELLVEWALELLRDRAAPHIADLATGSGCIALALASERPDARISATDASGAALAVARGNAKRLQLADHVCFAEGSWFDPLGDACFDLIVSNPPYIARDDPHLATLSHEPLQALTDGSDGLQCLREIAKGAPSHLARGGWLLVEHGFDQGGQVRELFTQAGLQAVQTRLDFSGHERATAAQRGILS